MKKLKLNLQQLNNVEVLTRSQLKNVLGGRTQQTSGAGRCVIVASTQGYSDCYYITGSASELCERVYGSNCDHDGGYGDGVDCNINNCIMN